MASKPRVKIPRKVAAGEVITIKTLISHPMESGQRKGGDGKVIPRMIINHFKATFNGQDVFSIDLEPAVAANPYIEFSARVDESGTFNFSWVDDSGETYSSEHKITVS